jgi:hypothetical protein
MGSREKNFYNAHAQRLGYVDEAKQIQDLYLGGDKQAAVAAVPTGFVDDTSLLGPMERIADKLQAYAAAGVTTLSIAPAVFELEGRLECIRTVAAALDRAGVGS